MAFKDAVLSNSDVVTTWNGAVTLSTSGNPLLELFKRSSRGLSKNDLFSLLSDAWGCDSLITLRLIAYIRDIKGGKGERDLGRWCLEWLAENSPKDLIHNLKLYVGHFGRWDDLISLVTFGPIVKDAVLTLIVDTLLSDIKILDEGGDKITLVGKWIPSEGKKSDKDTKINALIARKMKKSRKDFRLILTRLRNHLDILETKLCESDYYGIYFHTVPSCAMIRHSRRGKVFTRYGYKDMFESYKKKLLDGKTKVNAGAVYPHQLVDSYLDFINDFYGPPKVNPLDPVLEGMWKTMLTSLTPDQVTKLSRALCVVDTSSSMYGLVKGARPIVVAVALGLLISQINDSPGFKDLILTFNTIPVFHEITGSTLRDKISNLLKAPWGGTTNFEATFRLILDKAKKHNIPESAMPTLLITISDMQFNAAGTITNYKSLRLAYEAAGYKIPSLIFWNVNGTTTDSQVKFDQTGTAMISGFSVKLLRDVLGDPDTSTPLDAVYTTASDDGRYGIIVKAPEI